MSTLLPSLYKETVVNLDLIRTVQMGPWAYKVDDGLDARKTAYETMYTLVRLRLYDLDVLANVDFAAISLIHASLSSIFMNS